MSEPIKTCETCAHNTKDGCSLLTPPVNAISSTLWFVMEHMDIRRNGVERAARCYQNCQVWKDTPMNVVEGT